MCHYNCSNSEICHYFLSYCKRAITNLQFFKTHHYLPFRRTYPFNMVLKIYGPKYPRFLLHVIPSLLSLSLSLSSLSLSLSVASSTPIAARLLALAEGRSPLAAPSLSRLRSSVPRAHPRSPALGRTRCHLLFAFPAGVSNCTLVPPRPPLLLPAEAKALLLQGSTNSRAKGQAWRHQGQGLGGPRRRRHAEDCPQCRRAAVARSRGPHYHFPWRTAMGRRGWPQCCH
jgi:hypothetical protein